MSKPRFELQDGEKILLQQGTSWKFLISRAIVFGMLIFYLFFLYNLVSGWVQISNGALTLVAVSFVLFVVFKIGTSTFPKSDSAKALRAILKNWLIVFVASVFILLTAPSSTFALGGFVFGHLQPLELWEFLLIVAVAEALRKLVLPYFEFCRGVQYYITSFRIVQTKFWLLGKVIDSIGYPEIAVFAVDQSPWKRILKFGYVQIETVAGRLGIDTEPLVDFPERFTAVLHKARLDSGYFEKKSIDLLAEIARNTSRNEPIIVEPIKVKPTGVKVPDTFWRLISNLKLLQQTNHALYEDEWRRLPKETRAKIKEAMQQ